MGAKGTNLDDKNYEADLGLIKLLETFNIRPKLFYSVLKDYIYNTGTTCLFWKYRCKIYGLDIEWILFYDR